MPPAAAVQLPLLPSADPQNIRLPIFTLLPCSAPGGSLRGRTAALPLETRAALFYYKFYYEYTVVREPS